MQERLFKRPVPHSGTSVAVEGVRQNDEHNAHQDKKTDFELFVGVLSQTFLPDKFVIGVQRALKVVFCLPPGELLVLAAHLVGVGFDGEVCKFCEIQHLPILL